MRFGARIGMRPLRFGSREKWIAGLSGMLVLLIAVVAGIRSGGFRRSDPAPPNASSENPALNPTYASYDFGKTEQILDFGIQPLWVPGGIETEVMRRDSILKDELSRLGFEIKFHPFIKGIDVNYFMKRGDLEVAAGGAGRTNRRLRRLGTNPGHGRNEPARHADLQESFGRIHLVRLSHR